MSLKPWAEIARPHKDVLEGSFKQSEFAADITQVANGTAPAEYQDAENFFSRTFITEGMRLLLISVAQRLAGHGGDPVIQLQTAFGGGKTHTMLAVYHLASRKVSTDKLTGIPSILDEAGITSLPFAQIAVLDGIRQSPSQPTTHGTLTVNTLWGELAWQLLGEEGYAMVAESDADGTSPGKEVLQQLLSRSAPCVILVDELVAYVRQFELEKHYKGGTFDSNISFIQGLTEALKAVPNAILLASLPESELEVGGAMGQRALNSLEKYFARVESVWKPVGASEAFEIVRRRLFESAGERAEVEGISRQFSDFYRQHPEKFPVETQSNEYFERLCSSYPIHPEVFDRLYEDWSTLDKFQRTRGVLQYMAIVIHRLWNSGNRDALIMPGSLPLDDTNVRNKSIHYLPQGWEPVLEKEVDGPRSVPADIDGHHPLYGGVQAARRAARTIFLGSAPSTQGQVIRGIQSDRILLGSVQPGQSVGVFEDVLKRLRDRLHYLYSDKDRFWLDTKPNLRREMESRKQQIHELDELVPLLRQRVTRSLGQKHQFGGIHVFTSSSDVPDDFGTGPRLVVLQPSAGYSRAESNQASAAAEEILRHRGEQPRQRQNRLLFLAPDFDTVSRLKEEGRTYLAWCAIVSDIEDGILNQDLSHLNQAKRNRDASDKSLSQLVRETWKWLMAPSETFVKGRPSLIWDVVSISPAAQNLVEAIEAKLREEDWVIYEWAPVHLRKNLEDWYFKDEQTEISALKVWQDCCNYLYLPRIANADVFRDTLSRGASTTDYYGFAAHKEDERYLGFVFGSNGSVTLDENAIVIERGRALAYVDQTKPPGDTPPEGGIDKPSAPTGGGKPERHTEPEPTNSPTNGPRDAPAGELKTHFYATVTLDPVKAKMEFAALIDEVLEHFTIDPSANVNISVEIQAQKDSGFDARVQRTVKENCNTLRFTSAEFEKD